MNEFLRQTKDIQLKKTVKALEENQYDVVVFNHKEEVVPYLKDYLPQNCTVSVGGSVTLFECGVVDLLREGNYTFFDRYQEGVNVKEVFKKAMTCDYYFTSTNALTTSGELYNMDNNGNRVAALIYGPEHVLVITGENKIVKDAEEARRRLYTIAGPANSMRLHMDNPCVKTGECVHCHSKNKLCNIECVMGYQKMKGRIKVIIIKEDLGY